MTSRQATSEYAAVAGRAVGRVQSAIKSGKLIRPDICSECGACGRIEGHHHNGYSREHELDVVWLCRPCHLSRHHGRKPSWDRGMHAYMARTRPAPREVLTHGFTSHSTPNRLLKVIRLVWSYLRTDEERTAVLALVTDLSARDKENAA